MESKLNPLKTRDFRWRFILLPYVFFHFVGPLNMFHLFPLINNFFQGAYIRKHNLDSTTLSNTMTTMWELPGLMVISSLSKCAATCIAYPHGKSFYSTVCARWSIFSGFKRGLGLSHDSGSWFVERMFAFYSSAKLTLDFVYRSCTHAVTRRTSQTKI